MVCTSPQVPIASDYLAALVLSFGSLVDANQDSHSFRAGSLRTENIFRGSFLTRLLLCREKTKKVPRASGIFIKVFLLGSGIPSQITLGMQFTKDVCIGAQWTQFRRLNFAKI